MKNFTLAALAIALIVTACGKKTAPLSLSSNNWELYEVALKDSAGATTSTETPPMGVTLAFNDSLQMASGNGGCNRYTASYEMGDQNTIAFTMPVMTRMACPDMEFENRYLGWLVLVESYEIVKEELRLNGGNVTLVYKPAFE
jgi:heat shock protein HslJ